MGVGNGWNFRNFIPLYSIQTITILQRESLSCLVSHLVQRQNNNLSNILGHSEPKQNLFPYHHFGHIVQTSITRRHVLFFSL